MSVEETLEDPSVNDEMERERRFGQKDHVRLYGQDYPRRLEAVGFDVAACATLDFLDSDSIAKYGLLKDERLFVCS